MLAILTLALGNSFPLIPCSAANLGRIFHRQISSPGGLTDAIVAGVALSVLAFTPSPLWQRLTPLRNWQSVKFVLVPAWVVCPFLFCPGGGLIVDQHRPRARRTGPGHQLCGLGGGTGSTLLLVARKTRRPVP